jgi:NADH:ubiquinone oxidoreductase subunit 5 (subunit L)/multisubunit Na+/H+ antiporter MnhA subunit
VPARRASKSYLLGAVVLFLLAGFLGLLAIAFGLVAIGMTSDFSGNPIHLRDRLPATLTFWVVGAAFVTPLAVAGYFAREEFERVWRASRQYLAQRPRDSHFRKPEPSP